MFRVGDDLVGSSGVIIGDTRAFAHERECERQYASALEGRRLCFRGNKLYCDNARILPHLKKTQQWSAADLRKM